MEEDENLDKLAIVFTIPTTTTTTTTTTSTTDSSSAATATAKNEGYRVTDFMTKKDHLFVLKPTTTVDEALEALVDKRITGFLVIDDDWKLNNNKNDWFVDVHFGTLDICLLFGIILGLSVWYQAYYITTGRELARMVHMIALVRMIAVEKLEPDPTTPVLIDQEQVQKELAEFTQKLSSATTDLEKDEAQIEIDVHSALNAVMSGSTMSTLAITKSEMINVNSDDACATLMKKATGRPSVGGDRPRIVVVITDERIEAKGSFAEVKRSAGATLSKGINRCLVAGAFGVGAQHLATLFGDQGEPIVLGILVFLIGKIRLRRTNIHPDIQFGSHFGLSGRQNLGAS
ncbi:hypothetical protein ACFE04_020755 [Oxalis oulophora]